MSQLSMRALGIALVASGALFAQELPQEVPGDSLDIEPPLLIKEGPAQEAPLSGSSPTPELGEQVLQTKLERAKKSAAGADRLYKSGIIAKVEAEQRVLKVVRLEAELERTRLSRVKKEAAEQESRLAAGEISQTEVEAAKSAVAGAEAAAKAAAARKESAEMEAAMLNLHRQEKLLALGSARKSAVNRAQEKITALKRQSEEAATSGEE